MEESKKPIGQASKAKSKASTKSAKKPPNFSSKKNSVKSEQNSKEEEVLLNLPAGLKYKMPGKRQRVIIGSLVMGLNLILLIVVGLYFYAPGFKEFIYNVGRT